MVTKSELLRLQTLFRLDHTVPFWFYASMNNGPKDWQNVGHSEEIYKALPAAFKYWGDGIALQHTKPTHVPKDFKVTIKQEGNSYTGYHDDT